MKYAVAAVWLLAWCMAGVPSVQAQGLLWAIPDVEGRWVRYEGTYSQVIKRREELSDIPLKWTRHLTIKALNAEDGEIDGKLVPCRWIEIKTVTGPVKEGIIDAGPGGIRLYKILVPIELIKRVKILDDATVIDADLVLATYVPIAKGYRKIGNEATTPIETGVFQIFPGLTVLQHYRQLHLVGSEEVAVRDTVAETQHYRGELVTEDTLTRSTNVGELWRSNDEAAPFGVVKWQVTLSVEAKASTEPRSAFALVSEVTEEMATKEVGDAAESELVIE